MLSFELIARRLIRGLGDMIVWGGEDAKSWYMEDT